MVSRELTCVVVLIIVVITIATSGCTNKDARQDIPMRKIVEYPVVAIVDFNGIDCKVVLLEDGEVIVSSPEGVLKDMQWELTFDGTDTYVYQFTGFDYMLISFPYLPDEQYVCDDLVISKDGSAKFGSLEDDRWVHGHWY